MIHKHASISIKAEIGYNAEIGPYTIIHDHVRIGDNCVIEGFCEIGYPSSLAKKEGLFIGENSHIRSYSLFYAGSSFQKKLATGHRVTVRENTNAGENLHIGTLSDIQGDCEIGNFVRMHSNVHIGKKSKIGDFVWIFPYVVLTNDPHPPSDTLIGVDIKDYAIIATMSVVLPGIIVNKHALVGAHSLVNRDVQEGMVAAGNPAKEICKTSDITIRGKQESAYPWPKHFHRGYPQEIINKWKEEFGI